MTTKTLSAREVANLAKANGATRASCRNNGRRGYTVCCTVRMRSKRDFVTAMRAKGLRPVFGRDNGSTSTFTIEVL